jgi:hypothetical protein
MSSISDVAVDYTGNVANEAAIKQLVDQQLVLQVSYSCNIMLLGLMLMSFVFNYCILGKDMRLSVCSKTKSH